MAGPKKYAYLGTAGVEILDKPVFIVEVPRRGRAPVYYLTFGVWEYDSEASGITPQQTAGCAQIAQLFAGARKVDAAYFRNGLPPQGGGLANQTNPGKSP